jgi:hypothetical protein
MYIELLLFLLICWIQITVFIVGIYIGKNIISNNIENTNISTVKKEKNIPKNHINIDEKKVVLDINTKGLEKKYDSIAEETIQETDISTSVNKLKNMKG